jgi:3-oxo-4,17-pregnadiene-20-carboxyl-CoA hydratase alpha subunit
MTELYERLQAFVGREIGALQAAPDGVNLPMVRHWCEAMGDTNPIYVDEAAAKASVHGGLVAPPTMLQAWIMRPFGVNRFSDGPYAEMTAMVEAAGFTSVVASNSEQTYDRYLRPGDKLTMRSVIDSISDEKQTGLGAGHFITTRQDYFDESGERVGSMLFRILKFRPAPKASPTTEERPQRPRPSLTHDQLFWFDGLKEGKLLIQKCSNCGALRHPPGPMCRQCRSLEWHAIEATGGGSIHSYVVVHYPQIPSLDYPNQVVLVDLDEGVRVVANTVDTTREQLEIGARVRLEVQRCDDDLALPFFRVVPS